MRKNPLRELLNKLRWDRRYSENEVIIVYIHREDGKENYRKIRLSDVEDIGSSFLFLKDGAIPFHRIVRVEYGGETLYLKFRKSQGSRRQGPS